MSIDRVFDGGHDVQPSRKPPWPKACGVCALRRSDPQDLGVDVQDDIRGLVASDTMTFHCLHRTDGGRHRVCACAAAIARTGRRHTA